MFLRMNHAFGVFHQYHTVLTTISLCSSKLSCVGPPVLFCDTVLASQYFSSPYNFQNYFLNIYKITFMTLHSLYKLYQKKTDCLSKIHSSHNHGRSLPLFSSSLYLAIMLQFLITSKKFTVCFQLLKVFYADSLPNVIFLLLVHPVCILFVPFVSALSRT